MVLWAVITFIYTSNFTGLFSQSLSYHMTVTRWYMKMCSTDFWYFFTPLSPLSLHPRSCTSIQMDFLAGGRVEAVHMLRYSTVHWDVPGKWVSFFFTTRRFLNHVSRLLSRSHTFAIIVILDLKIHQSMWIHWPFFSKTWIKGHWPLDDLWPHVCWGHMCDSTQGSLCPSPMTIHQCMWIQWSILQNTTYIHILRT